MARIRTLKPTFWTDEKLGLVSREARYTFVGLISAMADDYGRLSGSARIIRGAVYPFDDDVTAGDVAEHLTQLAAAGRILRYRVNGDEYIAIRHWSKHQKVDRPSNSLIPAPPDDVDGDSSNVRRTDIERSTSIPAVEGEESSGSVVDSKKEPAASARDAETAVLLEAFPRLADALPPEDGRDVLLEFVVRASDKRAYMAECVAALDGMHGFMITAAELRRAVTDWLANNEPQNLRRFRGYLKGARDRPPAMQLVHPPRRGGAVQRTIDAGIAALLTTP